MGEVVSLAQLRQAPVLVRKASAEEVFKIARQAVEYGEGRAHTTPDQFGLTAAGWHFMGLILYAIGGQIEALPVDRREAG